MRHLRRLHRFLVPAAALGLLSIAVGPASGAIVNVGFAGVVDSVDPALAGTFSAGQALSGSYSFESTTPARVGSNSNFAFFDALTTVSFSIGAYSASSNGASEIQVDNDPGAPNTDRYAVVSNSVIGPDVGGNALTFFSFRVDDSTNTVFNDALLLPASVQLSSFDSSGFFVFFGGAVVSGTLTSLSTTNAIPEPSSIALLALGLGVLALRRFRQ